MAATFGDHGRGPWSTSRSFTTHAVSLSYFFYLKDHLGSVRATVNDKGEVVHYEDYYPYGLSMPGRTEDNAGKAPFERYTGHELDAETGLLYAGARYYDRDLGRWLVVDPLADEYASHSPYNYVLGNPMRLVDPDGAAAVDCCDGFQEFSGVKVTEKDVYRRHSGCIGICCRYTW